MHGQTMAMALAAVLLAGCDVSGRVEQGRVIAWDAAAREVTLIPEGATTPVRVRAPEDPDEMGPAPVAGKLLTVDGQAGRLVFYDSAAQAVRSIALPVVERRPAAKATAPRIDRAQGTITVYSPREKAAVTFSAPPRELAMPADTWKAGDVVRYYYREPGQALRMMNVTRTDLSKKG